MEKKFFILNVVGKSAFFYWTHDRENVEYLDLTGTEKARQEKVRREIPVVLVVTLGGNQSGASKDKRSIVWLIPVTSYAYRMRVIKDSRWRTGSEKIKNKDETGSP